MGDCFHCSFVCLVFVTVVRCRVADGNNMSGLACGESVCERQVGVLGEVVSGPARGRSLVLHLDPGLPQDVQLKIMGVKEVRHSPHLTMSLGVEQSWWLPVTSLLHIVLFLTHKPELLQSLWRHWKPTNLLLLSLAPGHDASILSDDVFSGVERLVLITGEAQGRPHVYTLLPFSSPTSRLLGHWHINHFTHFHSLFIDRFPSFDGYNFHLASWMNQPLFMKLRTFANETPVGVSVEIIEALSSAYNFTYTMTSEPPDLKWGALENGSWTGLLRMVELGNQNFTVNCLFQTSSRMTSFDIATLFWETGWTCAIRTPGPLPAWMNIHRPFHLLVWGCFLGSLVVALVFTTSQDWMWPTGNTTNWMRLTAVIFGQSLPRLPGETRHRIFWGVWLLCCLVVSASYTCNLVAILTGPSYPQHLETLQQLAVSDIRLATVSNGASVDEALNIPGSPLMEKLRAKRDKFTSEEDALLAMTKGSHALVDTEASLPIRAKDAYLLKERFYTGRCSWYFLKHTPWKSRIDQGITRLIEAGLIKQWYQITERMAGAARQKRTGRERSAVSLSLEHLEGSFYVLGLGLTTAFLALLLELLNYGFPLVKAKRILLCSR